MDRDELSRIDFPYLKGPFQIRGDTLIIPETRVDNSAINLWVNGWQNLETDDIEYSIRVGLKDLALRARIRTAIWELGWRKLKPKISPT